MKKNLLALLLAMTMIASLAACGAKEDEKAPAEDQNTVTDTTTPDDAPATLPEDDQPATMPEEDEPAVMPEPEQPETPEVPEQKPEEKPEQPGQVVAPSTDLTSFYYQLYDRLYPQDINGNATGPFVGDMAEAPEALEAFYVGLSAVETNKLHVFFPQMTGVPYEVALVEVANSADVETVKAILESRVDIALQDPYAYPMVTDTWTNSCEIVVNGNCLMLVCSEDYQAYVDAFNALFA